MKGLINFGQIIIIFRFSVPFFFFPRKQQGESVDATEGAAEEGN
jgi:hypothetical protein